MQRETQLSDGAETPTFVVGIGASAGGLKPIEDFFDNMPNDSGMSFVVVQHLSPDFKSMMDELLSRHTRMKIHKVTDGVRIEPDSIYLIPAVKNMDISNGTLLLSDKATDRSLNLPIDIFFRSLAKDAGERAIAIVLSGTGSDGSRGIKDIREAGGLVLVQSKESAAFDGMPQAAISTGVVDLICDPAKMPQWLMQYAKDRDRLAIQQAEFSTEDDAAGENTIHRVFRHYRQRHNLDFSLYKPATITRRLDRRLQISGRGDMRSYLELMETDKTESDILFRDLLVEVTHFFRDPEAFQRLRETVIPRMIQSADPNSELRVWVAGCATGEEAYSVAMCMAEGIEKAGHKNTFKVFATDVHRQSLEIASNGFYQCHSIENVPAELQTRYFTKNNGLCNIKREIRQSVIFAANDLTQDPPFTRLDMVTCRNVLIYLEPKVQLRVLSMFHFALKVGGMLFLGPSETVADLANEFEQVDRHWRIYSKRRDVRLPGASPLSMSPTALHSVVPEQLPTYLAQNTARPKPGWLNSAYEDLLARHVPPSLLINEFHELVHCFGDARKLLSPPEGKPSNDIVKMLDKGLSVAVSAALHRAKQEDVPVTYNSVRVVSEDDNESDRLFRVTVEPYQRAKQSLFLVSLESVNWKPKRDENIVEEFRADEKSTERLTLLERELSYTRETLQATVEELESSNEELQATNEELVASNEELQSTNEELHSVNEELYTVNSEHKQKIEELTELTSDMENLLRSTEIGTIFLDKDLKIRMFTPPITAGFNVMDQDIGRPIDHIAYKLDSPNLMNDVTEVLADEMPRSVTVEGRDGRSYLQQIQPYRADDRTDGIVLTLTDVTAVRESEQAKDTIATLSQINKELPDFAYAVSHDLQAPLRHISQYAEVLETAIENNNDEKALKASRVIANSSVKLRSMLDAMLTYSRINTLGKPLEEVALAVPINAAIVELRDSLDANEVAIETDSMLPVVMGDAEQLKTLFYHLIDNAIKYRAERPLTVQINCERVDEMVQLTVHDNGIGMEKRFLEDVFTIFRRIETKEEVPGDGVGLAICRRICLRHFGKIWIKSSVDEGTSVSLTLRLPENSLFDIDGLSELSGRTKSV